MNLKEKVKVINGVECDVSPVFYDNGELHKGILSKDTKMGKYTFRANSEIMLYSNGDVMSGKLVEGSEIEMRDGVKIPVNCDEEVEFRVEGKVGKFKGIGKYYDKRTKLTYNVNEGLLLSRDGDIFTGYVEPFEFGNLKFDGGEIKFDDNGDVVSINE